MTHQGHWLPFDNPGRTYSPIFSRIFLVFM
jgi:hypothetical protein